MNDKFMNELEGAARIIMAAPNLITNEQRRKAEEILLNFRKTKTPIRTCRQILEKSNVDYLHFEAAEVMKRGIIREWNFVSFSDKEDLIQYLFRFVVTRDIPCFVRDKILIAISIMVKRISADDNGKQRRGLLNQLEDLINSAENPKKLLGSKLISILMQEYATTCKSSDLGLPWEVHNKCKKQFETTDLIRIFKFVMGLLKDVSGIDTPFQQDTAQFVKSLLQIAEQVLVWSFNSLIAPKRIVGQFESTREVEDYPLLYFTMEWKDVFLSSELVPMMFMIYWKVRYSEELSHHALTCLIQLASVTAKNMEGRKLYNDDARLVYLRRYLENFSKLISSINVVGKEALGISAIAKKLCFCYHYEIANGLTVTEQKTFLDEITTMTCFFNEQSVKAEGDDDIYEDAFRNMISVWCYLFVDFGKTPAAEILKDYSYKIFSTYVQGKIAPPIGFRKASDSDEEIDNENEEDSDRIKYLDQLQVIGIFGRYVLGDSMTIMHKLLENAIEQLKATLQVMEGRPLTLDESVKLENIFEDIHWCLMISGHVVAIDSDGEIPSIPTEIMIHSRNSSQKCNLEVTLETLAKSGDLHWVNPRIDQCDDVIRLFSSVLRLCAIEDSAASIQLGHFMSPLVSCSLMWFIKRFCIHYLVPPEVGLVQPSSLLTATLGKQTEGSNFIVNFILTKIKNNIVNFYTEPVLLQDTVDLFGDIVSVKNKSQYFLNSEHIWTLIYMQHELKAGHLPPQIRRGLYKGFALSAVTFCYTDHHLMSQYIGRIAEPIKLRFGDLLNNGQLMSIHNEQVQNELVDIMECLIGICAGSAIRSAQDIFDNMRPIVETMVRLFKTYYNYQVIVQAVLELLCQSAKCLVCYLHHEQAYNMFRYSVEFVSQYAQCHANRMTFETSAEDFMSQDLAYILDILTYLLSKDYLDFCPSENAEETVKASTYVMRGFCVIMPFLSKDLLKYPNLCLQYYRLLTHINDMCPKEICSLDHEVMMHVLQSVEIGLSQFSPEVTQTCLDFISRICGYLFKHKMHESRIYDMLRPCVKLLLDLTLSNQIGGDLLNSVGEAVYLLVCCYPKEYEACVQMLVQGQQDPMISGRLSAAFDRLLAGIEFDNDRISRIKFKSNFEKFVFHVQGFLLVK